MTGHIHYYIFLIYKMSTKIPKLPMMAWTEDVKKKPSELQILVNNEDAIKYAKEQATKTKEERTRREESKKSEYSDYNPRLPNYLLPSIVLEKSPRKKSPTHSRKKSPQRSSLPSITRTTKSHKKRSPTLKLEDFGGRKRRKSRSTNVRKNKTFGKKSLA